VETDCYERSPMSVDAIATNGPPKVRLTPIVVELLAQRQRDLPVWIRAPKFGHEHYSGLSRAKLYQLAAEGHIRSCSLREPHQTQGTRLFNLASILAFIESRAAKSETATADNGDQNTHPSEKILNAVSAKQEPTPYAI